MTRRPNPSAFLLLLAGSMASSLVGCDRCSRAPGDSAGNGQEAGTASDGGVVNVTPIPTASVAAMVNPENLPAYAGPTGSVEGTVFVVGPPAPDNVADFRGCADASASWG